MGLNVQLVSERGEVIREVEEPPGGRLRQFLPWQDDDSFPLLRFVDWYGDTYFNKLQVKAFLEEWDHLYDRIEGPEDRLLLDRVKVLADRCLRENKLYLRFRGN